MWAMKKIKKKLNPLVLPGVYVDSSDLLFVAEFSV